MIYIIISLLLILILIKFFYSIQKENFVINNKKYVLLTNESPRIVEYNKLKKIYPDLPLYEEIEKVDDKYILRENIIEDPCSCKNFVDINKYQDLINKVNFIDNSYKDQIFNISQREQDLTNKVENYILKYKISDDSNKIKNLENRISNLENERDTALKETDKATQQANNLDKELNKQFPQEKMEKMNNLADKVSNLNLANMSIEDMMKLNPDDFR
jgi:predicted RNase H-like nuclease (RuvC/YqgF family)